MKFKTPWPDRPGGFVFGTFPCKAHRKRNFVENEVRNYVMGWTAMQRASWAFPYPDR